MLFCYPGITYVIEAYSSKGVDVVILPNHEYTVTKVAQSLSQTSSYLSEHQNAANVKMGYYNVSEAQVIVIADNSEFNKFLQHSIKVHHNKGLPFNFSPGAENKVAARLVLYSTDQELRESLRFLSTAAESNQLQTPCVHCTKVAPNKCLLCRTVTQVHYDITCDNCKMSPIIGIRLKDMQQRDFDLCHKCSSLPAHRDRHLVIVPPGVANYHCYELGVWEHVQPHFVPVPINPRNQGPPAADVSFGLGCISLVGLSILDRLNSAFPGKKTEVERCYKAVLQSKPPQEGISYDEVYSSFILQQGLVTR